MAVYYVELSGGDIQPNASLSGGGISVANTLAGGDIYPGGSGGGASLVSTSVSYTPTAAGISDTLTPPTGYDGFDQVGVTVSGDADLVSGNIKNGVTIFGVTGTYSGGGASLVSTSVSYTPSQTAISDTLTPPTGYDGFDQVGVSVAAIPSASTPVLNFGGINASGDLTVDVDIANGGYIAAGTHQLTETTAVTSKSATTYTPGTTDQTIAAGQWLYGNQTILGDADLVAGNIKKDVSIFGVTGTYEGGGGLPSYYSDLVEGTLNGNFTFPETTAARAFSNITGTFTLTLPNLTSFKGNNGCENSKFTSLYAPLLTDTKSGICSGCTEVVTIFVPSAKLGNNCFSGCSKLQTAVFGQMGSNYQQMRNCPLLKTVDCGASTGRMDNVWQLNCGSFDTFIIRGDTVLTLHNTTAFDSTKFASGGAGGTIYIPESLYNHLGDGTSLDYKAATNWSTINGYGTITWAQIEGSYYETHYADGTVIS